MKTNIINTFIGNVERMAVLEGVTATSFEAVLRELGIKVNREEPSKTKSSAAQRDRLGEVLKEALEKKFGSIREGKGKTAANIVSGLRAEYNVQSNSAHGGAKQKWARKDIQATVKWVEKSFGLEAVEAAGFFQACAKACRK